MIFIALSILIFVVILIFLYYRNKETFVIGRFVQPRSNNPRQNFTLEPVNETYTFAYPVPDNATSFDKILTRFTDKQIPSAIIEGTTFPEAAPYADSEIENVVKSALSRVKGFDAPLLDFISVEYAAKGVDNKKNIHYDIAFFVYDKVKNFGLKLALVCIVDSTGKIWIKKFTSFNSESVNKGPQGFISTDDAQFAKFVPDFTPYNNLY